jgi:putative peptidoglycan lipid II flippase
VLFERGEWTAADTSATAWALVFYGIGLIGHAALEILARTFYALHDTWTPVVVGGLAMALNVLLSLLFMVLFEELGADSFTRGPFGGLALANSLATAIESTVLWVILQRRIPEVQPRAVVDSMVRTAVAALVMVGVVGAWLQFGEGVPALVQLIVGIGLGAGVFWVVAMMLRVPEAQSVPRQILSRLKRT